jgi:alpha-D-ribose 1-methylphosphonate 5-triphosphate synthase subunit PhnI
LENCLSNILPLLCKINNSAIEQNNEQTQNEMRSMMDVLLENKETIVLEQNVPNPFAEQTAIDYTLPSSVQRAQILFYNQEGKLIKAVELTERGQGRINVFGSDLSSGIYTYSLVADGQIIATKRMVKTK